MSNVPNRPPSINVPSDSLLLARNKLVEACALSHAVADDLSALPPDTVPETLQALANVCERACREALEALESMGALATASASV